MDSIIVFNTDKLRAKSSVSEVLISFPSCFSFSSSSLSFIILFISNCSSGVELIDICGLILIKVKAVSIKFGNKYLKYSCKTGNNLSNEFVKSALIGWKLSFVKPFTIWTILITISGTIL